MPLVNWAREVDFREWKGKLLQQTYVGSPVVVLSMLMLEGMPLGALAGLTAMLLLTVAPLLLALNLLRNGRRTMDVLLRVAAFALIFIGCVLIWLDTFAIIHAGYHAYNSLIAAGAVLWCLSKVVPRQKS